MSAVVVVGIPLIGRNLCASWDRVVADLAQTLASVLRQSLDNFRIVVSSNEVPEGVIFRDPRIHYLLLPPTDPRELETRPRADLWSKKFAVRRWAAQSDARYFYNLDADDLMSNRLVEYLVSQPVSPGFVLKQGFVLDTKTGRVANLPHAANPGATFDRYCGSSIIVGLDPSLTPEQRYQQVHRIFERGHNHSHEQFLPIFGQAPDEVPFPAAVYRLNTGENLSRRMASLEGNRHLSDWIFEGAFQPDGKLRDEFGF